MLACIRRRGGVVSTAFKAVSPLPYFLIAFAIALAFYAKR